MSKFVIWLIIFSLVIGVIGIFGFNIYSSIFAATDDSPVGEYVFTVESGQDLDNVAVLLEQDKVINNSSTFVLLARYRGISPLQVGEYKLNLKQSNKPDDIINQIDDQTDILRADNQAANSRETVQITFKEGETLDQMFFKLEQNGVAKVDDLAALAKNPQAFSSETYPFLPPALDCEYGDIKKCAKYYLEGYLYPDTYSFFVDSSPEEVLIKVLNNFNVKVWNQLENKPSSEDLFEALILASVIEKETGRPATGITSENRDEVMLERQNMAQVFKNRTAIGQKWQSDVTAEYGQFTIETKDDGEKTFKPKKLCQQTFEIENCIPLINNPDIETKFNTYVIAAAPIGPVTNPQFDNIFAALNPINNDYYFFVSDVTGKKYFSSTETEFFNSIEEVKAINAQLQS